MGGYMGTLTTTIGDWLVALANMDAIEQLGNLVKHDEENEPYLIIDSDNENNPPPAP